MPQKPLTIVAEEPLTIVSEEPEAASKPPDQMGAIGRGLAGFWEQVNPVAMVQGLSEAVSSPIQTVKGIGQAQGELYAKAAKAFKSGDYVTGARHGINYLLPLLGPALDAQADKMMQGDIAGGIGGTVGIAANIGAPELAAGAVKTVRSIPKGAATSLRAGANERITDVIKPTVGRNKVRFANNAAAVAPVLAKEPGMLAFSREGLSAKVAERLEEASAKLDAADAARSPNQVFYRDVLARGLEDKLNRLKVSGVVTDPMKPRAEVLRKAIGELRQMGPVLTFDEVRQFRKAYDEPANTVYNPSLTQDFDTKMAAKRGAADVTGTMRERLGKMDPKTAEANADYHIWRKASDVIEAAEETDRARPKVGRKLAARLATMVGLGSATGGLGAFAGFFLGPLLDGAVSMTPTTRIATARAMTKLADAIDNGNPGLVYVAMQNVARASGQTARLAELIKSGMGSQPTGQMAPSVAESR